MEPGKETLTFGSLFSGIGGIDLGLERAGMECRWQVEINDYATRVLAKHWADVPRYRDIRECGNHNLSPVDLVCGGFPCQPHSLTGKRKASMDPRDMWGEFYRVIRELGPRYVLAENVPGLLSSEKGEFFGRMLRDLAQSGYDVEWECIPAVALGAYHRRDRVWIVAYANSNQHESDAHAEWRQTATLLPDVADTHNERLERRVFPREHASERLSWARGKAVEGIWKSEPNVGRVAHGVPSRVDRIKCLGNAVVPQVAELIGELIICHAFPTRLR